MTVKSTLRLIGIILQILGITSFVYVIILTYLSSNFGNSGNERILFWLVYTANPPNMINIMIGLIIGVSVLAFPLTLVGWIIIWQISKHMEIPEPQSAPYAFLLASIALCFLTPAFFSVFNDTDCEFVAVADTIAVENNVYHLVYRESVCYGASDPPTADYLLYECDSLDLLCESRHEHSERLDLSARYNAGQTAPDLRGVQLIADEDDSIAIEINGEVVYTYTRTG